MESFITLVLKTSRTTSEQNREASACKPFKKHAGCLDLSHNSRAGQGAAWHSMAPSREKQRRRVTGGATPLITLKSGAAEEGLSRFRLHAAGFVHLLCMDCEAPYT